MPPPAYLSPIIAATNARLPHNVRLLLAVGADPNELNLIDIGDYLVRYIRGRNFRDDINSISAASKLRANVLADAQQKGISHQRCPLTQKELDERSYGFPRFWTEPNVPGQRLRSSLRRALTPLEVAARTGSLEIVDMLYAAGADESAWMQDIPLDKQVENAERSISFLSISSPVHEAIAAG
jgi:hypothetical protein